MYSIAVFSVCYFAAVRFLKKDSNIPLPLLQVPEEAGMPKRHGPVLRVEQAEGGVHHGAQQEPARSVLAAVRPVLPRPHRPRGRRLDRLVRLGPVRLLQS
jgi:hypothetical protein